MTSIALFSVTSETAKLTIYDGGNNVIGTELVPVNGAVFYRLLTPVVIGRVEITREPLPVICCPVPKASDLYAVAFIGLPNGGSPRVEVPTQVFWAALP